ncbi:hypothetical protein A2774_00200 [Candidatus Roizmanbacteria bacterium RIFCSPHIGHO2_01_FULL_39_12c]|uniref:Uncharacterized protein n=1 Tax=Candidatus Roizmanbacteria bacterium RIFCSPHIGHO2_01_FULL_39_12c TaxID=1802031 RepID=A0A1F7GD06_9BACT|nr:MAG: hypothetical protein A2774_00200 [Candidatus Roizmanbacteria bacterium RIFCSPHIGHO2_01_FULL_39_12c]
MQKNKQKLLKYLRSQHTLYLATYDDESWSATVFYAIDDNLNIYFISEPSTKHAKAFKKNRVVSAAIADSRQKLTDKKIGVQLHGVVYEVTNKNNLKTILSLWHKFNPGFEDVVNLSNLIKKVIKSRFYQISPTLIKFFNEKIYGEEGFEIFKF